MKFLRFHRQFLSALMMMLMLSWQIGQPLAAATLYWDADAVMTGNNSTSGAGLGGSGTWNTTLPNWWDGSSADAAVTFTGADTAVFTGLGGTVQLGAPITLGSILFSQNIGASGFNLMGDGTAGSNKLTLAGAAAIAVNVAGADTISAVIAGSNGLNLSSTTTGTLILNAANTFTGNINISSGTLSIFADNNLGNSANDITFNGSAAAGLTLNAPMVLGAGRTITLNNTGGSVATLSSNGAAAQVVLGQVTGAGTLAVANAGVTYLLNTTNNYTGILWAQSGTISVSALPDASGNGNIKLGSLGATGGLQWNVGATGALTLTNRSIELAGTTGGGTIDSSSLVAANSITISNNLLFTTPSSGAKTLTLTGVNQGTNTFAGNITNNGTSTTALTKSGMDLWVLTGTGSNYSGALAINQGTLRVVNASGLGVTGNFNFSGGSSGPLLEIRSDVAPTAVRTLTGNNSNNAVIFLDHAATPGNTTVGQVTTFGTFTQANNTANINFVGNHGYGAIVGQNVLSGNGTAATTASYVLTNYLGSPGLNGYSVGANELVSIAGFTTNSTANTAGVFQTLSGWGNYTITGTISSPVASNGLALTLTKNGMGIMNYAPTSLSGWTVGTLTLSAGTTRINSSIATGGATVTLGTGLVELRNNASTNFGFNVANVSSTSTLFIDRALGGTASAQTATIGTLAFNSATTLNVVGDHGYNLVMGLITQKGTISTVIGNYLGAPGYAGYTGGTITLGGITTDATAGVATLTLAGFGDYVLGGTISSPTAGVSLNITKTSLGVVTFAGNNSGWTNTTQGILNANGGTTLIDATNTNAVGSANLTVTSGMLEILSATGTSGALWTSKNLTVGAGTSTLVVDPLAGSNATGQTVNLGGITGATQTVYIDSNHGYNLVFNGAGTAGNVNTTLYNIGNGTVTYAGGLTSTAATSTWIVGGTGATVISGAITNGTGTTALTKNGLGMLTLSGTGSNFTGNVVINSGLVKITDATALGAGTGTLSLLGNQPGPVGLDLRNNGSMDFSSRALTRTYGTVFNVDNNGSGTNGTVTLGGGMSLQDSGWYILTQGANGYSLKFSATGGAVKLSAAAGTTNGYTVWNYIPSVAGSGNVEFAGGLAFQNTASTSFLTFGGTGDFLVSGAISGTVGDTLTKSGLGTVTLSADSSASWNTSVANNIYTMTNGITRVTVAGALGGANAKVNVNSGVLDLRANTGFTLTAPITVGANNSYINVDAAVGSAGTAGSNTDTLSGVSLGAFTLFATGGGSNAANIYNLNTGVLTMTGAGTLINNIGNAGTLTVTSIAGTQATVFNGSGSTIISGTAASSLGTINKSGTGTVTFQEATGANTTGAITVNAGTLVADYTAGSANTIFTAATALTLQGGALQIKGATTGNTTQSFTGAFTLGAGGSRITLTPQGSGTTTFSQNTGAFTTTAAGGTLLVTSPTNAVVQFNSAMSTATTLNGRIVFFDGASAYNWLANTGANTASAAYGGYTDVGGTSFSGTTTTNDRINNALANQATTISATTSVNSLKIDAATAGGTLSLGGVTTVTNGGILFTGANDYTVTGTTAANGFKSTTADLYIHQYGSGTLKINAAILAGTNLDVTGTGVVELGGALGANLNTYTGTTFVNGGTLRIVNATRLGTTNNQALTITGGTFDVNGNAFNVGAVTGQYAGTIDNSGAATTLTVGNNNTTGSILGTIKNSGGALSIIKTGTNTLTLGDVNGMSSMAFTGDLTVNTAGASGANVLTLAVSLTDTAGTKINLGTATAGDNIQITYSGATNMIMNNRQIDLSGQSSATITASGVNGPNGTPGVLVINTNLLTDGTGAKSLTLGGSAGASSPGGATVSGITGSGSVATINAFNGNIGDASGGGALTLTITGSGGWSLGGNNSFTGGINMSSTGVIRGTTATAFGGASQTINWTGAGQLDLRSDSSLNFGNAITWGSAALKINVDRAVNGTGSGQVMTLGTITETVTGQTLTATNAVGVGANNNGSNIVNNYGLRITGLVLNAGTATTIANAIANSGSAFFALPTTGMGVAGALVIDNVSTAAGLGNFTLNLNTLGNSGAVTIISGDIVQGAGTTLALVVSQAGGGLLTLGGASMTSATNYSGGLTITGGGTAPASSAIVRAVSQYSLGTGLITAKGGYLEIRNDASVNYGNAITLDGTANFTIGVGEAINGTSGRNNTFTFGTVNLNGTARTFAVGGIAQNLGGTTTNSADNSGDSVQLGTVNVNLTGYVLNNNLLLPGMLTIGTGGTAITTTGTGGIFNLTLGGAGVTVINGNVVDNGTGLVGLTYNGTGILDLSSATSANLYSGGLTLTGGTTRVTNAFGLGASANVVTLNAGSLELRSDTNVTFSNQMQFANSGALNVGQLPGGTGSSGVLFSLGQLKTTVTAKTLTIAGIAGSLAASGDSVAFSSVDLNGLATTTLTNNLQIPGMLSIGSVSSSAAGAVQLILSGSGVTTVGDVTNGSGTVGLVYTGTGILDLSRMTAATNYSGGLNINTSTSGALVRITDVLQLGTATGVSFGGGTLEIRSDNNFTYGGALNWNANTGNVNISVGEVGTGTTTGMGKTFSFGALTVTTASNKSFTFGGIGGTNGSSSDSITVSNVTFGAGNLSNIINNNLSLPGTLSLGNITGNGTTGTVTLTIGGTGFTTIGDITNGSGGSITALTYNGAGIVQITPTAATNYSGGLNLTGNGTIRVIASTGAVNFGAVGTAITLTGSSGNTGTLDIRADSNLSVANAIAVVTNSITINVDAATSGNVGNMVTFGNATATSLTSTAVKTLTLTSGSNYGMTFTNGFTVNFAGYTITNNASGTVNLGALSYTVASGTLILGGSGYTVVGAISGTGLTNLPALTYSGTGFLDLTGNNASSNQVSAVTLSGAGGITRVNTATNLGAPNDTVTFSSTTTAATLQVRNDGSGSNGSIAFGNAVTFNGGTSSLGIIDVGNNGGSSTGNTVVFGALINSGAANAGTLTINGANGYGVSFASLALPSGTANVSTTLVANAPVAILGNVTNANTGTAAVADTLVLDGVSTGAVGGVISDGSAALTAVTKQGTGSWTFAGANTYTGATTINNGILYVNGSSAAGSAITVNGSATQGLQGILAGTGTIGGSVTLATNGATSFAQGAVINPGSAGVAGTLTINGTLTTNNFSSLNFDLGGNTTPGGVNDLIIASLLPNLGANTQININTLSTLANGSYTLMSGYTGTINLSNLSLGTFTGVDTIHSGALQVSDGLLQLFVTALPPTTAYWSGALSGTWNTLGSGASTNWRTDATSNVDTLALPDDVTDVHFYTTTPAVAGNPVTTILGSSFGIRTLTFDPSSTNAVSISGSVLTITPISSSTGITIDAAAGAVTINSGLALGAAQTWTNNSTSNVFTVTGNVANGGNLLTIAGAGSTTISTGIISGAGGLAKTGAGTLTLGAANTYTGATTLSGGTLRLLTVTNALPAATALSLSGTAILTVDGAQTLSGAFSDTATNTLNGSAVLTFNNGASTVNSLIAGGAGFGISQSAAGTLTLANTGSTSLGALTVNAAAGATSTIDVGAVANAAVSSITLQGTNTTSAPVLAGAGGLLTLGGNVTYTSTNNPLGGSISVSTLDFGGGQRTFTVGDSTTVATDLTVSSAIQNGTISKAGIGTLVLSGPITASSGFFNMAASSGSLITTGTVTSTVAQTLTNASAAANTLTGTLDIAGKLDMGSNLLTITGQGTTRISNTATAGGANVLTGGVTVNGTGTTALVMYSSATSGGNATGGQSVAVSPTLTGTTPILRLAPNLGTALTSGVTAGLLAKGYSGATSLAANNFLGAGNAISTMSGNFSYLNVALGGSTISNVPVFTAAAGFAVTTSLQVTGLLQITSAGVYNFSAGVDDFQSLVIDGNSPLVSPAVATTLGSMYLTAGLHTISYRAGNNSGNGAMGIRYQGADTSGALVDVPASAFFQANDVNDLTTTFTTGATLVAGTSATIDVAVNTSMGTIVMSGTGAGTALNVTGSGNINKLTISGITLTDSLTLGQTAVLATALMSIGSIDNTSASAVTLTLADPSNNVGATANSVTGVISQSGGGILSLTKTGSGTWVLSGASTYTGLTTISAGILQIGAGGTTGSLNPTGGILNNATLTFNRSNTLTQSTGIGNISGSGTVIQTGSGTLVLDGTNTYTGNTLVNNGTLNISGTGSLTGLAASTKLNINPTAGNNAVVNYSSTGTSTLFAVTGATVANTASAFYQTAGTINITPGTGTGTQGVVNATSAYGYYSITGGTFKDSNRFTLTNNGSASATNGTGTGVQTGVLFVGGTGTLDQTSSEWFLSYSLGQTTVADSGKIDRTGTGSSTPYGIIMNSAIVGGSYGVLNVAGSGAQVLLGASGLRFGNSTTAGNGDGLSGLVNLAAGTLSTGTVASVTLPAAPTATNYGYFNYAGGTLRATATLASGFVPATNSSITFIQTMYGAINNSAVAGAPSFNGGLTIDTNGFVVTIPSTTPLLAATGYQVTQADLTVTGGSGYIGAPAVIFSKPASASGVPAAGYALISGGSVVGIVITDPGVYAAGETPTVTLVGGFTAGTGTAATVTSGALATANSGTAGLIASGGGTLVLSAANTFGGTLTIIGGTTVSTNSFAAAGSASPLGAGTGPIILGDATTAGKLSNSGATQILTRGLTVNAGGGSLINTAVTLLTIDTTGITIASGGTLTLSTTAAGGITQTAAAVISGLGGVTVTNTSTGVTTLNAANSYTGATTLTAGTLSVSSLADGGVNSNIGAATSAASNLVLSGGIFQYTGGAVSTNRLFSIGGTFSLDASGSGALNFTNTGTYATPGTASARTLTLTGTNTANNMLAGAIADSGTGVNITSVTKSAAGTWVLSGTNTYTGATTVTLGTLQFAGAAALSSTTSISLNGGIFSYHDDAAGAIDRTANALVLLTTGSTIDVGNNGGVTTGSVVRFGALNQLTASVRILNITGSNGYSVELASLALSPGGGQTTTLNPTTASLRIAGNVTNGMSGFTSSNFDTIVLSGTTTDNSIGGVISDAVGGSPTAGGYTRITQNGGSTWRLAGQNTNTGAVAVQNGSLWLAGGDNRLNPNGVSFTLGTGTTSGKIIIGGNADGTTTAGSQRAQTFNQNSAASILTTSGTGTQNSIVGGADGGTSAGTPVNNSTLTLNIGAGFTETYTGLIGWDGTGSVGFQNNINLVKSGAGTLILTGDLSNWTGTQTNTAEGMDLSIDPTRPTITISGGVLRATGVINTAVFQTGGIFDDQTTSHGVNFYLKITGGLVTSNGLTDNAEDVVEAASHGVYAFNFNNNGTTGVSGSDMYLGAVGARAFSGTVLAAGASNTYRFGGGGAWNAVSASTLGGSGGYLQIINSVVVGANNVIIGDNGSYGGGLGIYGGNSSVEFAAAQTYTGTTTLAGGTLVFTNSNQLGSPATVAGSIILDGGILRYSGALTTDLSNRITIDSGGTIDIGLSTNTVTFASAIGNSNTGTSNGTSHPTTNGVGGLTKIGAGTLTLTAANTYAGTTTVSAGTLQLNRQTGSLNSASGLNFGGSGTFRLDTAGATGTLSQTLASLTFSAGDGVILSQRTANQNTTLTFSALPTRAAGATGNFTVNGTGATTAINQVVFSTPPTTKQFLNAGLYVGGTDFAVYDATGAGYMRAINYSTDTNVAISAGGTTLGAAVAGKDLQLGTAAVTAQTTVSVNSLKIAGAFGITLGSGQTLTIASGGLIKTGATATITGGTLATSGELVIRQDGSADALTIGSIISSGTGVAGNVALTKSGAGTLTLGTATNAINGEIVINGGVITIDSVNRVAGSIGGITLNGGGFTVSSNSNVTRIFTLGLSGGTLTQSNTSNDNTFGTAGDVLQLVGLGARTLTLVGGDTRVKTFNFSIGDNGGSTSLALNGSGDNSVYRLAGANTYTGATTINRGILRLGALTDLPGGVGGATLTSSNTGGGNLILAATGTNRAILELTSASGDFYRSVGTGVDQVQWTGNGGFSNQTANTTRIVNLGGAGATLVWGVTPGFVQTGFRLQFSQGGANVAAAGTVDFQNGINFGTAVRTLDVANGTGIVDAILSGNLTFGSGGGFTMTTGLGALSVTGTNNTGSVPIVITGGTLYFGSTNAVIGASGTITVTYGASAPAAIGLAGSTNPLLFWNSRLVSSSNGGFALDVNSSDNLDFSTGNVTNMRLTAFNPTNTAVYFTGTLTPSGTTYRFGGQTPTTAANAPATTLVLSNKNTLTGARSVDLAAGNLTLTASQNYSGGTGINITQAGANSNVGLGSDAALGTGTITLGTLANTIAFGAVNGDRVVYNRILDQQPAANTFVVAGDQASDGIANNTNQGAITYAGTLDLNGRTGTAIIHSRTGHAALFLGNISNGTGGLSLNNSTTGLFSILSTAANGGVTKTFSGATVLADNTTLVIDGDGSLGTSGGLTMNTSTLVLQPGSGAVVLNRVLTFSADDSQIIAVGTGGTLTFTGSVNGSTGTTAARTFAKSGAGMLVIQGANGTYTGNSSFANTLQIFGGEIQLDATNFTAASDRFFSDSGTLLPVAFGVASGTLGGGGTLEIVAAAGKGFALTQALGNLTINQGAHTIALTNNNATQALTLILGSTVTRTALNGGTLNFTTSTAGGTNTISSSIGNNAGGIIGGYATFNGLDWAVQFGNNTITALAAGSYTPLVAASNSLTGNFILSSGSVTLSTSGASMNTLKIVGSAGGTNLTLNGTNALTSGGVIFDNTLGSATISGGTQLGATGTEIIIFTGGTGSTSTNKLTLNGVIKGALTALTKSGSGTLVLAGANTYTGSLIINAGAVEFSNGAASQNLGNPTAAATNIILNGGVLRATATTGLIYGITVNGPAAIDIGTGVTLTQTAQGITGASALASTSTSSTGLSTGLLQKTGLGTLTLAGTTADSNLSIEIVGGVLNLGKTGALAVGEALNTTGVPYAALIVDNGAVANLTGTGGNQIGDASSVVVKSGGVFDVMGAGATVTTESIDGLAGTGTVKNTVGTLFTLTLGSNNSSSLAPYTLGAVAAGVGSTGLNNFGGVIQGNIALNKIGSGTQILSGNNTYSGATTINEGTLKLGTTNALPSGAGKGDVTLIGDSTATGVAIGGSATVLAPGTLDLGGYNQAINGLNSTTGGFVTNNPTANANINNTLTVGNGDASGAFNGVIMDGYSVGADSTTATPLSYIGTINLTKTGSGTQVLSGANTTSGVLTVNQGEVDLNTTGANAWAGNVIVNTTGVLKLLQSNQILDGKTLTVAGGTFRLNGFAETVAGVSLTGNGFIIDLVGGGALTSTTTYDLQSGTVSGILAGSVGVSKTTAGTVTLSGANTFTGKTSVTGGVLSISADNNLGAAPGANVDDQLTLDGGTLQSTATLTIASTRRITVAAGGGTFDTATGTTTTISSVLLGAGSIVKTGAGTLIFTAVNTYTGKTSIQQGAVSVASLNSVATPAQSAGSSLGKPTNAANGTIDLGATTTTGALIYTGTGETTDRVINLAGTTGGGTLDQSGTGVVKFTSDLTATGAGSKVLTLQGSTAGTGEISGAIVDNGGGNTTGVTKAGTGTWVLSGTNTYTGATTVNGGTLQVGAGGAGSIGSSAVTVNSTGTLSGSGTVAGSTFISSGGVLAPGDGNVNTSNATLTFSAATASLTVADAGSIHLSLTTADSTDAGFASWFHAHPGGTAADYVASIGGIANTGSGTSWNDIHSGSHDFISAADTIVLGSSNTSDQRVVVSLNSLTGVAYGSVFNLMDWSTLGVGHDDSALSAMGAFNVANNLQLQDLSSVAPGLAWDTSLFDSYGILVLVPEPGRVMFFMLGLLGLLMRRRRKIVG